MCAPVKDHGHLTLWTICAHQSKVLHMYKFSTFVVAFLVYINFCCAIIRHISYSVKLLNSVVHIYKLNSLYCNASPTVGSCSHTLSLVVACVVTAFITFPLGLVLVSAGTLKDTLMRDVV